MDTFREVITPTKEGIIAYLASGQIKGIGPKTAEKIYNMFGADTLNMLDANPEKLLEVPGISKNKLEKICESYLASRGARDIVHFWRLMGSHRTGQLSCTASMEVRLWTLYETIHTDYVSLPASAF